MTTTYSAEGVIESLDPFATIPAWLAAPMQPACVAGSLRTHVAELASGEVVLQACTADRLRAKGAEWLVRYTLRLAWPDGREQECVLVGRLFGPQASIPASAPNVGSVAVGDVGWSCFLPDLRLELRTQALDDALPALPKLVDPSAAAELLQPLLRQAGYSDATIAECEPVVVRYKPGSRCTVVVRMSYVDTTVVERPPDPVVVKTHQGDKGESAWEAMTALWNRSETWGHAVRLAEPIAYLPDERILVQGPVPEERTLKELAREAIRSGEPEQLDRLRSELGKTARALAALHLSGARYARSADLDGELEEVTEVVQRLSLSVPELDAAAEPLLRLLRERAAGTPADPVVPAHHDFRPAQVLLHGGELGFIDFDGSAMAEPALDLGRFRAKLRDIGISTLGVIEGSVDPRVPHNLALLDDLCDHFLNAYQEHAPVSTDRVLLWETCDLVTTMLHAWTKVRLARLEPRLATLVHQLRSSGLLAG